MFRITAPEHCGTSPITVSPIDCFFVCFSSFFPFEKEENKTLIRKKGGIELLIKALKLFPESFDVQQSATGALLSLSGDRTTEFAMMKKKKMNNH
jgi:hypothetical protein